MTPEQQIKSTGDIREYMEKESPLKQFALGLILLVASSTTLAAENFTAQCQNLAGRFFFANNPSQSVTIEQNGCVLSMTSENSGNAVRIEMNQEKESPKRIKEILETLDRRKAGPTAPPQGLYLTRVYYPPALDNQCRKL